MDISYFVDPFINEGYLSCSSHLATMNNAALNIRVQIFVGVYIFASLGYMPVNSTARSCDNSAINIFRNCRSVFKSNCPVLQSRSSS